LLAGSVAITEINAVRRRTDGDTDRFGGGYKGGVHYPRGQYSGPETYRHRVPKPKGVIELNGSRNIRKSYKDR